MMKKPERKAVKFDKPPTMPAQVSGTPFGPDFQGSMFKLVHTDGAFAMGVAGHLDKSFFGVEPLAWGWEASRAYAHYYHRLPTMNALVDMAQRMPDSRAPLFAQYLWNVKNQPVTDEAWIRDRTLDFIRKAIFKQAMLEGMELAKQGKIDESYDLVMDKLQNGQKVTWAPVDRGFFAEEFVDRMIHRQESITAGMHIPTGIGELDHILEGGAYAGFLGTWIARPKTGKTTLLCNLGVNAMKLTHRKVLHVVAEGKRTQTEARYDSAFTGELYSQIKRGEMDSVKYAQAMQEIQFYKGLLVWRSFTSEGWETRVSDIDAEIRNMRQLYGWDPDLIIVDYADLLWGHQATYTTTTERQKEAYQNLKTLTEFRNGYAVWTASQVQRPGTEEYDVKEELLRSKDIADAYAKVRICDFIGSINQTIAEKSAGQIRLYAELYRDNAANKTIYCKGDFSRMQIGTLPPGQAPWVAPVVQQPQGKWGTNGGNGSGNKLGWQQGLSQQKNGV